MGARSKLTIIIFLLILLVACAAAWPWHDTFINNKKNLVHKSEHKPNLGEQRRCETVIAEPRGISTETAVHICQKGSDLCYFSALRRCCGNSLREAVPVSGSDVVSFGDENKIFINVTFNLVGGLCSGEEVGVCFHLNHSINVCPLAGKIPVMVECIAPTMTACQKNAFDCSAEKGCHCKPGFMAPCCCKCIDQPDNEGIQYYRDGDQCLRQ